MRAGCTRRRTACWFLGSLRSRKSMTLAEIPRPPSRAIERQRTLVLAALFFSVPSEEWHQMTGRGGVRQTAFSDRRRREPRAGRGPAWSCRAARWLVRSEICDVGKLTAASRRGVEIAPNSSSHGRSAARRVVAKMILAEFASGIARSCRNLAIAGVPAQ